MARVSVLVSNYNYAEFLPQAVRSVLDQDVPGVEVILVDDGSTDASLDVIRPFADRIRIVSGPNGGQAAAINRAFDLSSGELIFLLDSDDYWLPGKLRTCVEYFDDHPGCGYLHHEMHLADAGGRLTGSGRHRRLAAGSLTLDKAFQMQYDFAPTSCMGLRRSVLQEIFPIPEEIFRIRADYYLQTLATRYCGVGAIHEPLACYRLQGRNSYSGALSREKLAADLELINRFAEFLRDRFHERVDPTASFYYARSKLYQLRRSGRGREALGVLAGYLRPLRESDLPLALKLARAITATAFWVQPELGLKLFRALSARAFSGKGR